MKGVAVYLNVLVEKFKEVLFSVLPITLIVICLHFTIAPLEPTLLYRFLIGAGLIVLGLTIFLLGTDIGITPIGTHLGKGIGRKKKVPIIIGSGIILGFFISIAEPDLQILSKQVAMVTDNLISSTSILIYVSIGIAIMMTIGLLRVVFSFSLRTLLLIIYGGIFALSLFVSKDFLAIAFDASGATTGALTVPFILALSLGVSTLKRSHKDSEEDTFGLVAISSSGAIIAVMLMSILGKQDSLSGSLSIDQIDTSSVLRPFMTAFPHITQNIFIALCPVVLIFLGYNYFGLKLPKQKLRKIMIGSFYVFLGLVLFLVGVDAGFMEVGSVIGHTVGSLDSSLYLLAVAFILGLVTILAEPAVYVLTHQIETATNGYVKRKIILVALSLGVGLAVLLSVIRILIPGLELWHFLLPGYIISLSLMYVVPNLFVGMAFDAGGVASGPMTATFILAFIQGAAEAIDGADVLLEGFGMIAMVAMMPIITLQLVGFMYKLSSRKEG